VVKLEGAADLWRIRVGQWCVIYRISDRDHLVDVIAVRIAVMRIGNRPLTGRCTRTRARRQRLINCRAARAGARER
jgi:hypothetical protein